MTDRERAATKTRARIAILLSKAITTELVARGWHLRIALAESGDRMRFAVHARTDAGRHYVVTADRLVSALIELQHQLRGVTRPPSRTR